MALLAEVDRQPRTVETGPPGSTARLEQWILMGAAFLLPLAFLPNIVDGFVLSKLLLARLLVITLTVLLLVRWFLRGAVTWRHTPLDLPLVAFIASAALSTVFAVNRNVAVFGTYDRWEGLLTIVTYALFFWLAVQLLSDKAGARRVTWSLLVSGYLIGAAAILQSGFGLLGAGYFRLGANGPIRADVTLANPDFLGIFLAMLLPVAFAKVISRRPASTRVLAANLVLVISLGLIATFTRAAWIGAIVGAVIVLALRRGRLNVWPVIISAAVLVAGFAVLAGIQGRPSNTQGDFTKALAARVVSIGDFFSSETETSRPSVWRDTLTLIAHRPIVGYGPDNFGLVYPQYQTVNRLTTLWDKPHQEILGVLASQGLLGLVAYLWILFAFVKAFWKGRYLRGAVALFAGWAAYEVSIQADFSWIPTAIPFWLFAATAIVTWAPEAKPVWVAAFPRRIAFPLLVAGSAILLALLVPAVALPYVADANYYATQAAPGLKQARAAIARARQLAPYEAAYAVEAGDYALNLDQNGNPAANADWWGAREAYEAAARLGSFSPEMFRKLALVDEHFGDHTAAVAAARRAIELDRYDADSQTLLKKLTSK